MSSCPKQQSFDFDSYLPGAEELLVLWLEFNAAKDMDPIGAKGEAFYRHFWNTYLSHLQRGRGGQTDKERQPIKWHEVTPADITAFLHDGPSARNEEQGVSDITRRRYWRLLSRIYNFAVAHRWVSINPVTELPTQETPAPEDPVGAILNDRLWNAALREVHELDVSEPVLARNKALLLLFFYCGLTPQEARTLPLNAIVYGQEEESSGHRRVVSVKLDGAGPNQRRRLVLPDLVAEALGLWLRARQSFPNAASHEYVFCSRRNPTMSPDNLFVLVKDIFKRATAASGQEMPVRMGPQIIRNTCLVRWLKEGVPTTEVALRAGLKNIKGLYHLRQHVEPEIRITLRSDRDDEVVELPRARAA